MTQQDKIIVVDQDGGYIVAEKNDNVQIINSKNVFILVYKYKEYYHDLESAVRDEFESPR